MTPKRPWRRWTADEDALIREHYPERGSRWKGWALLMPDRMPTNDDIAHRARAIGVRCNHKFRYGRGKKVTTYVLYRGDEVIGVGSKRELAERFHVKPETIAFYGSPANRRRAQAEPDRMLAVRVSGDA